ncbi:MAG: hypothetical protein GX894_04130, partial [Clostridia bacterium]|nr:hypothetical protein [Clostridia bacterium]
MKMMHRVLLLPIFFLFFILPNRYEFPPGRRQTVKPGMEGKTVTGSRAYANVEWGEDFMKAIATEKISKLIQINQLGYRPQDRKVAVIDGHGGEFFLVRVGSHAHARENEEKVVFAGTTTEKPVNDGSSGAR